MARVTLGFWVLLVASGTALPLGRPSWCLAQVPPSASRGPSTAPPGAKPSFGESISSGLRQAADKFTGVLSPKPPVKPAEDPVSLQTPGRPSEELYVAVARLYHQADKHREAEKQYRKALQVNPNHLGALLGYARTKDLLDEPEAAKRLYLQALRAHPKEASVYNNLALFYARRGMLAEAVATLRRAVQLQPQQAKYRNNLATVLVEMGQRQQAFGELRAVHREAVAYYNLGYLLEKKGQPAAAAQHYQVALGIDPALSQARRRLAGLKPAVAQARSSRAGPAPRAADPPAPQQPSTPIAAPRQPASDAVAPPAAGGHPAVRQLPPVPKSPAGDAGRPGAEIGGIPGRRAGSPRRQLEIPRRLPPVTNTRRAPGTSGDVAPLPGGSFQPTRPPSAAPLPPEMASPPLMQGPPRMN